jgi:hypothetical protein
MHNKEHLIREARTIEAMKNGYMGLEGKFVTIAKHLGESIFHQGSIIFNQNLFQDPYEIEDPNEIPTIEEDENSYEIGIQFDGLSRGINMTISVSHYLKEIICRYEGRIVYHEISGELEMYAPDPIWEKKIEQLNEFCRKIEKKQRPIDKMKKIEENKKRKMEILDQLRKKWGI